MGSEKINIKNFIVIFLKSTRNVNIFTKYGSRNCHLMIFHNFLKNQDYFLKLYIDKKLRKYSRTHLDTKTEKVIFF